MCFNDELTTHLSIPLISPLPRQGKMMKINSNSVATALISPRTIMTVADCTLVQRNLEWDCVVMYGENQGGKPQQWHRGVSKSNADSSKRIHR